MIPSLRCGGAERVFTLLLNGLSAAGMDMHLGLCQCEGYWLERLSPGVTVHDLRAPRARQAGWSLVQLARKLRPRAILSTSSHLNTVAGLCRPFLPRSTRLFLREVSINHFEPAHLRGLRGPLLKRAYRSADAVVALTDGMRGMIEERLGVPSARIVRIFNPVESTVQANSLAGQHTRAEAKRLVAVGSLTPPKGFDRLIAAFPALLERFPGSMLTVLGEGPERGVLEQQIRDLGLASRIDLAGFSADVGTHLAHADLFVLPSRFEGMPNALLEAIGAGRPTVVLDHPGGTREVMQILGQEHRITTSLEEWKDDWFAPVAEQVLERARLHFGLESIVKQYQDLLFADCAGAQQAA
ncbi:glycosyltransferase [Caulifigura coniformis]|uniref:glycosyltransferase n=1 Tax=Caulifigura coniformis TaxID=2527983 RepID=UPI0018D1FB96|nr:glycosyltransferase [Caulifigura coniformis]